MKNKNMPWKVEMVALGKLMLICAISPPIVVNASSKPASKMPSGVSRPRKATTMAAKP